MKQITINLLIKRLRVVRSGMCINDRERMLHLINELERLEKAGYDTVDVLALKCIECGHEIPFDKDVWLYGGVSDRGAIPMSSKT